jgi:hypothetical protein
MKRVAQCPEQKKKFKNAIKTQAKQQLSTPTRIKDLLTGI